MSGIIVGVPLLVNVDQLSITSDGINYTSPSDRNSVDITSLILASSGLRVADLKNVIANAPLITARAG